MSLSPLNSSGTHCSNDIYCPGGNCAGCRGGKLWCSDPKCNPHCTDCEVDDNEDQFVTIVFFSIILILLFIAFIFVMTFGSPVAQKYMTVKYIS